MGIVGTVGGDFWDLVFEGVSAEGGGKGCMK
jgi:hypothetical protein